MTLLSTGKLGWEIPLKDEDKGTPGTGPGLNGSSSLNSNKVNKEITLFRIFQIYDRKESAL